MIRVLIILLLSATLCQASEPNPAMMLYRLLVWGWSMTWPLKGPTEDTQAAHALAEQAHDDMQAASNLINSINARIDTNQIATISFGWPLADRLPPHNRQNVMGEEPWRKTIWQDGEMYHAHYITFNAFVSTNPTVLSIEYSGLDNSGAIQRWNANVISNSYPNTESITVGTNTYNCYIFYNRVPAAITNAVIDWDNEVIFGAPEGSGRGFSIEGVFVIDDGDNLWVGINETNIVGSATNVWINGLEVE